METHEGCIPKWDLLQYSAKEGRTLSKTPSVQIIPKRENMGIRPKKRLGFLKKVRNFGQKMVVSWAICGRLRPGFHQSSSFTEKCRSALSRLLTTSRSPEPFKIHVFFCKNAAKKMRFEGIWRSRVRQKTGKAPIDSSL